MVLAVVGALSLGSAVVEPTVASAHTASDAPSLKLSPSTGVLGGSRVLASGAGWARGSASLFECALHEQGFDSNNCDLLKTVAIGSSGRWSKAFSACAGSLGNGGGEWCGTAKVATCYVGMTQGATTVNAVLTYKLPRDVILPIEGSYIDESTATVKVVRLPGPSSGRARNLRSLFANLRRKLRFCPDRGHGRRVVQGRRAGLRDHRSDRRLQHAGLGHVEPKSLGGEVLQHLPADARGGLTSQADSGGCAAAPIFAA